MVRKTKTIGGKQKPFGVTKLIFITIKLKITQSNIFSHLQITYNMPMSSSRTSEILIWFKINIVLYHRLLQIAIR